MPSIASTYRTRGAFLFIGGRADGIPADLVEPVNESPVTVATDGSHKDGAAGWAWVSDAGRRDRGRCDGWSYPAELVAIRQALVAHSEFRTITVVTDNMNAINAVRLFGAGEVRKTHKHHLVYPELSFITRFMATHDVRFEWVRGHSGHRMNEAADSLALLARNEQHVPV